MESETDNRQVLAARWPQLTPLVEALTAAESVRRLRDPMALHKLLTIATDVPYNPGGAGCARLIRRAAAVPHPQQRTRGVRTACSYRMQQCRTALARPGPARRRYLPPILDLAAHIRAKSVEKPMLAAARIEFEKQRKLVRRNAHAHAG